MAWNKVGNAKHHMKLVSYGFGKGNPRTEETAYLQGSDCNEIVGGRNEPIHTPISIDFRPCLLHNIHVFFCILRLRLRG
jgi:hypothetical protein